MPFASDLYEQYNRNEPWDSENNRRVLKKMPRVYRGPGDSAESTNTSYFVLTGPGTVFSGKEGTRIQDIADGTSDTILLVETKRAVPWTKSEDIPYADGKPIPKLGGWYPEGFRADFVDGSVHFIRNDTDEETLRRLINRADGKPTGEWIEWNF